MLILSLSILNSNLGTAVANSFHAEQKTATLKLKRPANNYERTTALLFLCSQSCDLIGIYAIGINYEADKITKIYGTDAALSRNDTESVTITFQYDGVWSDGIIIADHQYIK